MDIFKEKQDCCGCTACMTVCSKDAITMKSDEKGFLYPVIDDEKCVSCGLCVKTCAFQNGYDTSTNFETPLVYAVKNHQERKTSQSGGMAAVLTNKILELGGVVYGAGYGDNFYVMHKRAETKDDALEFKGSKYVQSDMNTVYAQIIEDLQKGRFVLFSGTACQIAGLNSCLKNINTEKLYTCDLVCHGVPSPLVFNDYLNYLKKYFKADIVNFNFRDKTFGWHSHVETIGFNNGIKVSKGIYADLFYKHIILRPSCGACKYTNIHRPSDITLADFWGIEKTNAEFDDNKGISLVMINTEKGRKLFADIKSELEYIESNVENCLQPNLIKPTSISADTDNFWKDYAENGFEFTAKKYGAIKTDFKSNFKFKIKLFLLKTGLMNLVKKLKLR